MNESSALQRYLGEVRGMEVLSREREHELAALWRDTRSQAAARELLQAQLRHVVVIARRYRRYGVPLEDLIAQGNLGLLRALDRFDPDRGTRFCTYAQHWIRALIIQHVLRSRSIVQTHSGAFRTRVFFKLRRERRRLEALLGEGPESRRELARVMGVEQDQLGWLLHRLDSADMSLDAPVVDGSPSPVERMEAGGPDQEESAMREQLQASLEDAVGEALQQLGEREQRIVRERLMADEEDRLSLAELGRQMGVSRERARQLELRAKTQLRRSLSGLARTYAIAS